MNPISCLELDKRKSNQFEKKGLSTVESIVEYFPYKYLDFRKTTPFRELVAGNHIAVEGVITEMRSGGKINSFVIQDQEGKRLSIGWFNSTYYFNQFQRGQKIYCGGKVTEYNGQFNIINPSHISTHPKNVLGLQPAHRKIKGVSEDFLVGVINDGIRLLERAENDTARTALSVELGLIGSTLALEEMHKPTSVKMLKEAKKRTDYDKLWRFYNELYKSSDQTLAERIEPITKTSLRDRFIEEVLPYQLTEGQQYALDETSKTMMEGTRLNSLIAGDVGCGKTVIALLSALTMIENGYQTVILAPTMVLANQHQKEFTNMLSQIEIDGKPASELVGYVCGKTKASEKKKLIKGIADESIKILIGTHAALSEDFAFPSLGLVIIDEEHKFGVAQKDKLRSKSAGVHYMALTATPIPRSIAMSLYGKDTSILPIKSMPQGRKPTITNQFIHLNKAFDAVCDEVDKGFQAYLIAPLIEKSDSEKMAGVLSVEELEELFKHYVSQRTQRTGRSYTTASINGKMSEAEVLDGISDFAGKSADVLISTTIVEVGVNVPNATVICIVSAERFGLSALHQLRGRVGRGGDQGYCLLYSEKRSEKLDIICAETNGFVIAEEDLRLRGPGDLVGEQQKGMSEMINLIISQPEMAMKVRDFLSPPKV